MVATEVRRSIEARLASVDILMAAAQRQREFVAVLTDAADDERAVAALRLPFDCTEVQAAGLLGTQLRRFATAERTRAEAERGRLEADHGADGEAVATTPPFPAQRQLVRRCPGRTCDCLKRCAGGRVARQRRT
jgi:hypothetical protein